MRTLLKTAMLAGLATAAYRWLDDRTRQRRASDKVDAESEQSFPASDPPGNY